MEKIEEEINLECDILFQEEIPLSMMDIFRFHFRHIFIFEPIKISFY